MRFPLFIMALLSLYGCSNPEPLDAVDPSPVSEEVTKDNGLVQTFVQRMESAHKRSEFLAHEAVSFEILLTFGEEERLNATVTLSTDSYRGKYQVSDGRSFYFVGDRVFVDPNYGSPDGLRFDAYTWSYFFLLPYKLSDKGTMFSAYGKPVLNGTSYEAERLTFEPGTGDAPDDWYILYADLQDHLLQAAAYIVTDGSSVREAELDPHAIRYSDYKPVDGIPFAYEWTFWEWRQDEGLTRQLGQAALSNIRFIDKSVDKVFEVPEEFLEL